MRHIAEFWKLQWSNCVELEKPQTDPSVAQIRLDTAEDELLESEILTILMNW